MSYPTLSVNPSSIEEKRADNTISIEFDGGYKQTRERNTRDLKKFTVIYPYISRADKDLIETHINTVRGSQSFDWINVDTNTTYKVRYTGYPSIKAEAKIPNRFNITLEMEEV